MIRTRFAPSPTGYMHIGNLRTALFAYLLAKQDKDGVFILRIEDTDQKRTVEDATAFIYKCLKTAEIIHDEGPDKDKGYGPYIQSQRREIYHKYIDILLEKKAAYRCFCTKEEVEEQREEQKDENVFRDKCRNLTDQEIKAKLEANLPFVIRQRIPEEGSTTFSDLVYGDITVENKTLDEQVLMKSDGLPTYNFANVIDDHLMEITHVIRGYEYLSSAPKYNLLYQAFGFEIPKYIHMPHIMKENGKKMAKRDGDSSFYSLIEMGYLPKAIINYIALLGWNPGTEEEIFTMEELIEKFSVARISKSNAIFSIEKLNWINSQHLKALPFTEFKEKARDFFPEQLRGKYSDDALLELVHQRLNNLSEIAEKLDFFLELKEYDPNLFVHKKMKCNQERAIAILEKSLNYFEEITEWNNEALFNKMVELSVNEEIPKKAVLWAIRIAIAGKKDTPGGFSEIAAILGKKEVLKRVDISLEILYKYKLAENQLSENEITLLKEKICKIKVRIALREV